jgi:hypothetical protein
LFSRNEFHLPFVVDSPAGPLDHPKRNAVAQLIPKLAGQFIAFVISTEREGFQDVLQRVARGRIQYLTLFRKGDAVTERLASKQQEVAKTSDGILVCSREFFEGFQVDEEARDAL